MRFGAWKMGGQADAVGANVPAVLLRLSFVWYGIGALIVGLLLARWTWVLFAPHTLDVLPPKPDTTGEVSSMLFGAVAVSSVGATTGASLSNVRLLGVFSGQHGFAVLRLDDKRQLGVALGEEVVKGTRLVEVAADHVVLDYNGVLQRVNLENKFAENKGASGGRLVATSAPGSEQAIAGWNTMSVEMQKMQKMQKILEEQKGQALPKSPGSSSAMEPGMGAVVETVK